MPLSCTMEGWVAVVSAFRPFRHRFSVCYSLVGLLIQDPLACKASVWGIIFQVQVLKFGLPGIGFRPFAPQRITGHCEFPSNYGLLCWEWGSWWDCLSLFCLFWCIFFLICLICKSCSASFLVSFVQNCPICSHIFGVSAGEGSFRFSYFTILNWNSILHHRLP